MKKWLLVALLIAACAPESGTRLAVPINASLGDINKNAQSVLKSGAQPQDKRVIAIIKDDQKAQKDVATVTIKYDYAITKYDKAQHRIFIDDCVFGGIAFILLLPILLKLAPFLLAL